MMNKITIIGSGNVGSTIAYTLTITGLVPEIVMIDINGEKALGEAMDIRQGTPFCPSCNIYAGDYDDAKDSDIVIITCGVARKPGQTRLDLAQINIDIMKMIIPQITRYAPDATYVIVSNPVDILTYVFTKLSGIPENRIIGSGTILDTSRLRSKLSELYSINQKNVHAYVLGEHGDSSFVPWSHTNISNIPIEVYKNSIQRANGPLPELNKAEIEEYVKKSGSRVIQQKGATYYAVSMSVCHLCKCLLSGLDTTVTVSTIVNGEYGLDDVCLSLVNTIGSKRVNGKLLLPLEGEELEKLHLSAENLKNVLNNVRI
ncbi:MAG: L-lactate dehydrogenase [Clostridia bacterium]|nr:L-lactate dehydrogenase [Clostridia bacterium]